MHGDAGARSGGDLAVAIGRGVAGVVDGGFEGLVDAVLGPGLGEGFEFDVGGVSAQGLVVVLDGLHLVEVEEEVSFAREFFELMVVELADGDVGEDELVGVPVGELLWMERHSVDPGDDGVGQELIGQGLGFGIGDAQDIVSVAGGDRCADADECEDGVGYGLCRRIHDPGERVDLDECAAGFGAADDGAFDDGVGQKLVDDLIELIVGERCFDEVDPAPMGPFELDAEGFGVLDQRMGPRIASMGSGVDFDPMNRWLVSEIRR